MSLVSVFSNPIRRRRKSRARNALGEFISRHRRRRNPESRAERSRAARLGALHRRRRRNPESHRERVRAARLGARHRRRRHNPAAVMGDMKNVMIPALVGAGGALGLNILLGYLKFLPTTLQTGYGRAGVQVAGALAIGAFGPKIGLSRRTSTAIAAGITVIALYDVVSGLVATKFPNVNLGETFRALPPGMVLPGQKSIAGYGEVFMNPLALPAPAEGAMSSQHTFG